MIKSTSPQPLRRLLACLTLLTLPATATQSLGAPAKKAEPAEEPAAETCEKLAPCPLNPAKGWTVWHSPKQQHTITWPTYGDFNTTKSHTETLDGELEITVTPFTWKGDYTALLEGLHCYNLAKLHEAYSKGSSSSRIGSTVVSRTDQLAMIGNIDPDSIATILPSLEKDCFQHGVHRILIPIKNCNSGPLFPVNTDQAHIASILEAHGYRTMPGVCDWDTGNYTAFMMKELSESTLSRESSHFQLTWEKDQESLKFPELSEFFGIFVRNQQGLVLGGMWCTIPREAAVPHAFVGSFFMDESIRGTGLGREAMKHLEDYVLSRGINLLCLGTSDHQAPWFYEKIGYQRANTIPAIMRDREGKLINSYNYYKQLKNQ